MKFIIAAYLSTKNVKATDNFDKKAEHIYLLIKIFMLLK